MTQLLTIAGGVMAVYILLALITSHVCEWISAITNQRGHLLERAIVVLLGGVQRDATRDAAAKELVDHLYDHPLMGNLGATKTRLAELHPRAHVLDLAGLVVTRLHGRGGVEGRSRRSTPAPMPPAFSAPDVLLDDLKGRVTGLPDGRLKSTLVTVLQGTKNDYDSALKAIDTWFDAQMDRVGGAYKRWAGIVQAIIALIVVVGAQQRLAHDPVAQLHDASNATAAINAANSVQRPKCRAARQRPCRRGRDRRLAGGAARCRRLGAEDSPGC